MQRNQIRQARLALVAAAVAVCGVAQSQAGEVLMSVSNTGVAQMVPQSSARGSAPVRPSAEMAAARSQASVAPFEMTDAEYASFQQTYKPIVPAYAKDRAMPETVLGADRRFRYSPKETGYPYQAVGQITFTQNGNNYICSGWLVSPDTVMTAGHCVHSGGSNGSWSTNVMFYPGRNGKKSPFGGCSAKYLNSQSGWTSSGAEGYDYGSIKLNCTVGNNTGWFGWWVTTNSQVGAPIVVLGYPGDKQSGTAWGGAGQVAYSEALKTRYFVDSAGGMSGGVVVQADGSGVCQGDCGIAVHAYGQDGLGTNSGTRITQEVSGFINYWRNTP